MSHLLLDPHKVASEKAKVNSKKTQKVSDAVDSFGFTQNGRVQVFALSGVCMPRTACAPQDRSSKTRERRARHGHGSCKVVLKNEARATSGFEHHGCRMKARRTTLTVRRASLSPETAVALAQGDGWFCVRTVALSWTVVTEAHLLPKKLDSLRCGQPNANVAPILAAHHRFGIGGPWNLLATKNTGV